MPLSESGPASTMPLELLVVEELDAFVVVVAFEVVPPPDPVVVPVACEWTVLPHAVAMPTQIETAPKKVRRARLMFTTP
jgi:hypothetical protein